MITIKCKTKVQEQLLMNELKYNKNLEVSIVAEAVEVPIQTVIKFDFEYIFEVPGNEDQDEDDDDYDEEAAEDKSYDGDFRVYFQTSKLTKEQASILVKACSNEDTKDFLASIVDDATNMEAGILKSLCTGEPGYGNPDTRSSVTLRKVKLSNKVDADKSKKDKYLGDESSTVLDTMSDVIDHLGSDDKEVKEFKSILKKHGCTDDILKLIF